MLNTLHIDPFTDRWESMGLGIMILFFVFGLTIENSTHLSVLKLSVEQKKIDLMNNE